MGNAIRIPHDKLVSVIEQVLGGAGVPPPVRTVEAEIMAEADLLGVPSHGVRMLPGLVQALREGRANPNPRIQVVRERAACCLLDGDNGPGRYVSAQAMQRAVSRAQMLGVGACAAARVTHWGRAHAYAYRAALAGCIGLCTTNAIPNMLAWDSTRPLLGNNPLAIGVPRGSGQEPIVLDLAMSQAAVGKVATYLREGKTAPQNWGLDADGKPTNDPAAILSSRKLLPFGDHKGVGLALMMELLTGALTGGMLSHEIAQADASGLDPNSSKLFIALDVDALVGREPFAQRVDDLVAFLSGAEPGLNITYPGERGWQTRTHYLAEGIPIHSEIAKQLEAIGVRL